MIKTKGMVHFTIPVTDLQRAKAFYCDLVGFDFIRESPRMVFCRSGNDYFVLTISKTPINPNAEGSVSIHHAFYVEPDEFDRAVRYLKGAGVKIRQGRDPRARGRLRRAPLLFLRPRRQCAGNSRSGLRDRRIQGWLLRQDPGLGV